MRYLNHDSSKRTSRDSNPAHPHYEVKNAWIYSSTPIRLHNKDSFVLVGSTGTASRTDRFVPVYYRVKFSMDLKAAIGSKSLSLQGNESGSMVAQSVTQSLH
jgi:hypothetical protein